MAKNNKVSFNEISKARVRPNCMAVISECSAGGYTIAQQVIVKESEEHNMRVFLKGAIHVKDIEGIKSLRDALNVAISEYESKNESIELVKEDFAEVEAVEPVDDYDWEGK